MIIQRRKFLIGLASSLAAPAIVKADSLMQVGSIDHILYPIRGIMAYEIMSDRISIRIDRANFELNISTKGVLHVLSNKEIKSLFSKEIINYMLSDLPKDRKWQRCITKVYDTTEWLNKNLEIPPV